MPELLKAINKFERALADVMQLGPQAVEFGRLRIIKHESPQVFVLPVVKGEGNHFIDGNNFGVTERGGEQLAK